MRGGNKAIVRNELLAILWQGHDAHWEVWGHFSSHHPTRRKHLLMLLLWYLLIPIAPILFDHYCLIWSPCYLSLRLLKQIPNSSPFSSSSAELWPQCCSDYFTEPGVPPSMPSALTLYHTKTQPFGNLKKTMDLPCRKKASKCYVSHSISGPLLPLQRPKLRALDYKIKIKFLSVSLTAPQDLIPFSSSHILLHSSLHPKSFPS